MKDLSRRCTGSAHLRRGASRAMVREELGRGQGAEGLMRPDMVRGVLPGPQGRPEGAELELAVVTFIALLGLDPLGAPMMSRAAKCLRTTPGSGRMSRVSSSTRSPGVVAPSSLPWGA